MNKEPKKSLRRSVRGSIVAYVGGQMWGNFGDWFDPNAQRIAQLWLENYSATSNPPAEFSALVGAHVSA